MAEHIKVDNISTEELHVEDELTSRPVIGCSRLLGGVDGRGRTPARRQRLVPSSGGGVGGRPPLSLASLSECLPHALTNSASGSNLGAETYRFPTTNKTPLHHMLTSPTSATSCTLYFFKVHLQEGLDVTSSDVYTNTVPSRIVFHALSRVLDCLACTFTRLDSTRQLPVGPHVGLDLRDPCGIRGRPGGAGYGCSVSWTSSMLQTGDVVVFCLSRENCTFPHLSSYAKPNRIGPHYKPLHSRRDLLASQTPAEKAYWRRGNILGIRTLGATRDLEKFQHDDLRSINKSHSGTAGSLWWRLAVFGGRYLANARAKAVRAAAMLHLKRVAVSPLSLALLRLETRERAPVSFDRRMNNVMRIIAMFILRKVEDYTMCIQLYLKQGFQKCSFYREQPITKCRKQAGNALTILGGRNAGMAQPVDAASVGRLVARCHAVIATTFNRQERWRKLPYLVMKLSSQQSSQGFASSCRAGRAKTSTRGRHVAWRSPSPCNTIQCPLQQTTFGHQDTAAVWNLPVRRDRRNKCPPNSPVPKRYVPPLRVGWGPHALAPHRSSAHGVQCFRRDAVLTFIYRDTRIRANYFTDNAGVHPSLNIHLYQRSYNFVTCWHDSKQVTLRQFSNLDAGNCRLQMEELTISSTCVVEGVCARVARLLQAVYGHSPPTTAIRVRSRISACGNRAGRCRLPAGFLGVLPFPPPLHFQRRSLLGSHVMSGDDGRLAKLDRQLDSLYSVRDFIGLCTYEQCYTRRFVTCVNMLPSCNVQASLESTVKGLGMIWQGLIPLNLAATRRSTGSSLRTRRTILQTLDSQKISARRPKNSPRWPVLEGQEHASCGRLITAARNGLPLQTSQRFSDYNSPDLPPHILSYPLAREEGGKGSDEEQRTSNSMAKVYSIVGEPRGFDSYVGKMAVRYCKHAWEMRYRISSVRVLSDTRSCCHNRQNHVAGQDHGLRLPGAFLSAGVGSAERVLALPPPPSPTSLSFYFPFPPPFLFGIRVVSLYRSFRPAIRRDHPAAPPQPDPTSSLVITGLRIVTVNAPPLRPPPPNIRHRPRPAFLSRRLLQKGQDFLRKDRDSMFLSGRSSTFPPRPAYTTNTHLGHAISFCSVIVNAVGTFDSPHDRSSYEGIGINIGLPHESSCVKRKRRQERLPHPLLNRRDHVTCAARACTYEIVSAMGTRVKSVACIVRNIDGLNKLLALLLGLFPLYGCSQTVLASRLTHLAPIAVQGSRHTTCVLLSRPALEGSSSPGSCSGGREGYDQKIPSATVPGHPVLKGRERHPNRSGWQGVAVTLEKVRRGSVGKEVIDKGWCKRTDNVAAMHPRSHCSFSSSRPSYRGCHPPLLRTSPPLNHFAYISLWQQTKHRWKINWMFEKCLNRCTPAYQLPVDSSMNFRIRGWGHPRSCIYIAGAVEARRAEVGSYPSSFALSYTGTLNIFIKDKSAHSDHVTPRKWPSLRYLRQYGVILGMAFPPHNSSASVGLEREGHFPQLSVLLLCLTFPFAVLTPRPLLSSHGSCSHRTFTSVLSLLAAVVFCRKPVWLWTSRHRVAAGFGGGTAIRRIGSGNPLSPAAITAANPCRRRDVNWLSTSACVCYFGSLIYTRSAKPRDLRARKLAVLLDFALPRKPAVPCAIQGATVAERLACAPPTRVIRDQSSAGVSEEIWAALNIEVFRADEGDRSENEAAPELRGRGKQEIPEKTRRPTASSGTIPTCETRPEIEPGSPWWEASVLTAQPPNIEIQMISHISQGETPGPLNSVVTQDGQSRSFSFVFTCHIRELPSPSPIHFNLCKLYYSMPLVKANLATCLSDDAGWNDCIMRRCLSVSPSLFNKPTSKSLETQQKFFKFCRANPQGKTQDSEASGRVCIAGPARCCLAWRPAACVLHVSLLSGISYPRGHRPTRRREAEIYPQLCFSIVTAEASAILRCDRLKKPATGGSTYV
ncbi:hypothetical protein PR048_000331 [Dryococelus australis]|uniref:Uncharacterized protein n=1 Tax=Dryococelus australis TaxID=614101 RepID=A0ABQ9IEC7_9NEOP|nr:hypothetical protein PR048_000331 [Dryococelus australis]